MKYVDINWDDGQPRSDLYSDLYYSANDGLSETEYVFIRHNKLVPRFKQAKRFVIAESGFGTGLNFIATCQQWLEHSPDGAVLSYVGIEKHPVSPMDIKKVAHGWVEITSLFNELIAHYPQAISGSHLIHLFDGRVELHLEFLDVDQALIGRRFQADAWFLDGFNPKHNADMWSDSFFKNVAQNSKSGTTLSTYTAAGHVRRGLEAVGFNVTKVKGHANKREMITATLDSEHAYHSTSPWYDIASQSYADKTAIVIGAGLAGLTTAMAMVKKGWHVTIIDRHKTIATEASGNPAGILLPRMNLGDAVEQQFYVSAFLYAVSRLDELQKKTDNDFWHKTGVVSQEKIDKSEKILAQFQSNSNFISVYKSLTNDSDLQQYKKLHYSCAGWVNVEGLCKEIFSCIKNSVCYLHSMVNRVSKIGEHWSIYSDETALASASVVVFSTGRSLADIDITSWLPVKAIRGQITAVDATAKSELMTQAHSFGRFCTPAHQGVHFTGASYDLDNLSPELTPDSQKENMSYLYDYFPDTFEEPTGLTGRVGFRAVSEDRMPVIGLLPERDWFLKQYADLCHGRKTDKYLSAEYHNGIFINGGHGSRGLTSCFVAAEILVSIMESSPLPVTTSVVDALQPSRFIIRNLKRSQNKPE